jgi:dipeptidase E
MKLYLSSFRLGDQPEQFLYPHAPNNRVAVIQNAQDHWADPVKRKTWLDREFDDLRGLGLEPVELDLRKFFGRQDELREEISRFAYCWAMGGNCFVLRGHMPRADLT